jgi:4-hydroxybenzoyl-CoA thioesterase
MSVRLAIRIYLEDTDAGGIVYHTSYLRFMERARTELLRSGGFEQSRTFEDDLSFVLHSMQLRFHTPAQLDDEVEVSCELLDQRGASMTFRQQVISAATQQVHCEAEVVVACIRLESKRPRRIPKELVARLQQQS